MIIIVIILLLAYLAKQSYNYFVNSKPQRFRKISRSIDKKDWKYIDQLIKNRFNPEYYEYLQPDDALIKLSEWLNLNLREIIRDIPRTSHNFSYEWKKKLSQKVRQSIKNTQYVTDKDCSVNDLYTEFNNWNINAISDEPLNLDFKSEPKKIKKSYSITDFTIEDLQLALKNDSDSHDIYDLSFEIIKYLPSIQPHLVKYYNRIALLKELSPEWKNAIVFFEKKHGKRPTLLESVRPLTKLPTMVRLYHKMLTRRMMNFSDTNQIINRELQKGNYRCFSGVQESILLAKGIIEKASKDKLPLSMLFLDIKNAYGSIKKQLIIYAIKHYQFPEDFINYVENFYTDNEAKVTIRNNESESFKWNIGIYQGCSLSNLLFLVSINLILEDLNIRFNHLGFSIHQLKIVLMAFVDDIVLITEDRDHLIQIFNYLEKMVTEFGFQFNYGKLRLLEINQDQPDLVLNGHQIERIQPTSNGFKYLGSYLTLHNDRKNLVETYYQDLKNIFERVDQLVVKKNVISNYQKYMVYQRQILPKIRWILISESFDKDDYQRITQLENFYLNKWMPNQEGKNQEKHQETQKIKDQVVEKGRKNIYTLSKDKRIQEISMEKYQTNRPKIEKEKADRLEKISSLVENEYDNLIDFVLDCDDQEFEELTDLDLEKGEVKRDITSGKLKFHTYTNTEEYQKMET